MIASFLKKAKREGSNKAESKAKSQFAKKPEDQWVDRVEKACHGNIIEIVKESYVLF